jgi:hypothetical protein
MARQPKFDIPKIDIDDIVKSVKGPTSATYDPARQAAGSKRRLEGAGIDVEAATDTRNPVEKFLNLRKDQFFLLDALELLQRPQQAWYSFTKGQYQDFENNLYTPYQAKYEGILATKKRGGYKTDAEYKEALSKLDAEIAAAGVPTDLKDGYKYVPYLSVIENSGERFKASLDAAWDGLTGNRYSTGGDLLSSLKPGVFRGVSGFVVDVVVDPIDFKFIKVKGVTKGKTILEEAAQAAIKLEKAGNSKAAAELALKALNDARSSSKAFRLKVNNVNDLVNVLEANKSTASNLLIQTADSVNSMRSGLEFAFQSGLDLSRGIVKKSDALIITSAKFADKIRGLDPTSADAMLGIGEKVAYLTRYTNLKTGIDDAIKSFVGLPQNVKILIKKVTGKKFIADSELYAIQKALKEGTDELFTEFMDDIAAKIAKNPEIYGKYKNLTKTAAKKLFDQDLQVLYEAVHRYRPKVTLRELFKGRKNGVALYVNAETMNDLVIAIRKITGEIYDEATLMKTLFKKTVLGNGKEAYIIQDYVLKDIYKNVKKIVRESSDFVATPAVYDGASTITDAAGRIRLNPNRTLDGRAALDDFLDAKIDASRFYTDAELDAARKLLEDAVMGKSLSFVDEIIERMAGVLDPKYGTKFKKSFVEEGLAPHNVNEAWVKLRAGIVETSSPTVLKGDAAAFTARGFNMSATEAQLVAEDILKTQMAKGTLSPETAAFIKAHGIPPMFTQEMQMSLTAFASKGTKLGEASSMMSELALKGVLLDTTFVRAATPGKIPVGFEKLNRSALLDKLEAMSQYIDNPKAVKDVKKVLKSLPDQVFVDTRVFAAIGVLSDPKELSIFIKAIDGINNLFKAAKLYTWGFLKNNVIGNLTNMFLSGIGMKDIAKHSPEAFTILKEGPELLYKQVNKVGILDATQLKRLEAYKEFVAEGFVDVNKELLDLPPLIAKSINSNAPKNTKVLGKLFGLFAQANNKQDMQFRMVAYLIAKENPTKYLKLGLQAPGEFVRYSLFDPNELSKFEKQYVKRLIPFYTFTKKNMIFQAKTIFDNPNTFYRLRKWEDKKWDIFDLEDEDVEEYKRESGWIPIFRFKDGKYISIKANMPSSELDEFLKDPLNKTLGSFAPAIRAPFEIASNYQLFTGRPVQEFEGQESRLRAELKEVFPNLPSWAEIPGGRLGEYMLSQSGLDTPLNALVRTPTAVWELMNTPQDPMGDSFQTTVDTLAGGPLRSIIGMGDPAQSRLNLDYQNRDLLADKIRYYKQQGVDVPTITELENRRKFRYLKDLEIRMSKFKPRNR